MDSLIIEGMRCFRSRKKVAIKPLTLLIGENNTGKTTFLSAIKIAWDISIGSFMPDFNEQPFSSGPFDEILTKHSGPQRKNKFFCIGLEIPSPSESGTKIRDLSPKPIAVVATFKSVDVQPEVHKFEISCEPYRVTILKKRKGAKNHIQFHAPSGDFEVGDSSFIGWPGSIGFILLALQAQFGERPTKDSVKSMPDPEALKRIYQVFQTIMDASRLRPYAFAPIRTKPLRTYEPSRDIFRPEGEHIPIALSAILDSQKKGKTAKYARHLNAFGRACGLFDNLRIRHLGEGAGDPFQIHVELSGLTVNVVDVGYGVSQILPLIVDTVRESQGQTFLIQQPEVHLHPRAQAELASFFGALVSEDKKKFVIETHSDYMIDRIRLDIRDRRNGLRPEDVAILYFERTEDDTLIHHISIDEYGNLHGVPPNYRKFFMEEEHRLFGIDACVS